MRPRERWGTSCAHVRPGSQIDPTMGLSFYLRVSMTMCPTHLTDFVRFVGTLSHPDLTHLTNL